MNELIYLYTPRGYSPGYCYRNFDDALAQFLKDSRVDSLEELAKQLEEYDVWYEFDVENCRVSVDDGGHITEIELL